MPSRERERVELRQLETGGHKRGLSGKRKKSESGRGERTEPCDTAERLMKMHCLHPTAAVTQIRPVYWEEWWGRSFVLTAHWLFRECSVTHSV